MRSTRTFIYTHNLQYSDFENPALPDFENRVLGELGDPKDEFQWFVDLTKGVATFGYKMHYIGPMWTGAFEDFNSLESACSAAGCPPFNADFADIRKYPRTFYHDIRAEVDLKNMGHRQGPEHLRWREQPVEHAPAARPVRHGHQWHDRSWHR